jgi:putative transposase
MLIEHDNPDISLSGQCRLLTLSRSSFYYRPHRDEADAAFGLRLLNAIDELYTDRPNLGRYGMTDALAQERQIEVNPKCKGRSETVARGGEKPQRPCVGLPRTVRGVNRQLFDAPLRLRFIRRWLSRRR